MPDCLAVFVKFCIKLVHVLDKDLVTQLVVIQEWHVIGIYRWCIWLPRPFTIVSTTE